MTSPAAGDDQAKGTSPERPGEAELVVDRRDRQASCRWCGAAFWKSRPSAGYASVYCSVRCRRESTNARTKARRLERKAEAAAAAAGAPSPRMDGAPAS